MGSDSEGEESSTRKKRRQTTSSSSEVVDLTLASAHAAARGRQRNVGDVMLATRPSSVSTVVEIQAGKRVIIAPLKRRLCLFSLTKVTLSTARSMARPHQPTTDQY